jgi:hypothetical protein
MAIFFILGPMSGSETRNGASFRLFYLDVVCGYMCNAVYFVR